jgi:hypothetical protein
MDRKVLSNRIQGLSEVFASDNAMHQDLKAMSYVLSQMSDEKFANVVNPEFSGEMEKEAFVLGGPKHEPYQQGGHSGPSMGGLGSGAGAVKDPVDLAVGMMEKGLIPSDENVLLQAAKKFNAKAKLEQSKTPVTQGVPPVNQLKGLTRYAGEDLEDGAYWNKEASDKVRDFLLKDVVGMDKSICCDTNRHLDKEQMPDATKKQTKPATLKEEQTPKLSEALDSKIVEKAKAAKPVNKEAGSEKGPGIPDGTGPGKDSPECPKSKEKEEKGEKKEEKKKEKKEEKGEKKEDKKEEKKEEKKEDKDANVEVVEGIELTATDMDVTLSADDEAALSKLFN